MDGIEYGEIVEMAADAEDNETTLPLATKLIL